jgi:hypothetical protein
MKIHRYITIILIGIALSCISPLDLKIEEEDKILVVEGYITTQPGPHFIRLTTSAKYGSVFEGQIKPEPGADIWIRDELGNITNLIDADFGNYQTPPNFKGEVGKSYVLNITTARGEEYTSLPETIQPVPKVDALEYSFKELPTADPVEYNAGVEVFGVWQDPPDERNFYLWRNTGVYNIRTFPENFMTPGGENPPMPAPKPCCNTCWVTERNADFGINIYNDLNTNGATNSQLVAFIPDNRRRFMDKYEITIQQFSISKEAYSFFNLLKSQKSINGDIFDPPPATIRGNIINLENPELNVIGFFYASDVYEITDFIERENLDGIIFPESIDDDCRVIRGASTSKPPDWD